MSEFNWGRDGGSGITLWWIRGQLLVFACCFLIGPGNATAQDLHPLLSATGHRPQAVPAEGQDARNAAVIRVGMEFLNWEKLDTQGGTFRFAGILSLEWNPAAIPGQTIAPTEVPPKEGSIELKKWDGWQPSLTLVNSLEGVTLGAPVYFLQSNGNLRAEVRILASSVRTQFHFRRFPFDTQTLTLQLAPDRHSEVPMRLEALPNGTVIADISSKLEWDVTEIYARPTLGNRIDIGISIKRYWPYYMANMFMPMFLLVCISYGTLWIARAYFAGAFSLVAVTIASLFLLKLSVTSNDSRALYITFMDVTASFHLLMASAAAITDVILSRHYSTISDARLEGIASHVRLAFPIFYVTGLVLIVIIFHFF
ncbi:MAG TPA: hypothetical protein VK970_22910 [Candidatus Methylacidiphilales bacterium]|nr:hypothetical protein [Candidatus Methylacidiphilales bacterium]